MISEIRHAVELGHLSEECAEKCIAEIHAVEQVQHKQTERYGKTLIHADIFCRFLYSYSSVHSMNMYIRKNGLRELLLFGAKPYLFIKGFGAEESLRR